MSRVVEYSVSYSKNNWSWRVVSERVLHGKVIDIDAGDGFYIV